MPTPRSSRGHAVVATVIGVAAAAHGALALVPSARPGWFAAVSAVLALAGLAVVVVGLRSPRAVFGGEDEDRWLVSCAAVGALGVAADLGLALALIAGSAAGVDLFVMGALVVDALVARVAVFTLRRVPLGR